MRGIIRTTGAFLVVALAVAAAVLVPRLIDDQRAEDRAHAAAATVPGDRARDIIDTFSSGKHLYVADEMSSLLTSEQAAAVEQAAANADPAVFIALAALHTEAGYDTSHGLIDQIAAGIGSEGVFLLWNGEPRLGVVERSGGLTGFVGSDLTGKKDQALLRFIADVESEVTRTDRTDEDASNSFWGGIPGGTTAGLLLVAVGYPLLILAIGVIRLFAGYPFLLPGRWRNLVETER